MSDVNDILIKEFGIGYKKPLTDRELLVTIRNDQLVASSIPDTKRYKVEFIDRIMKKYVKLGAEEALEFWQKEKERIVSTYPLIHKEQK